jgi:ATP:ADP antiporter, AAA family
MWQSVAEEKRGCAESTRRWRTVMLRGVLSILNAVEGEERPVLLLLGLGFFTGVFMATYKIVATTLFLDHMADQLKMALFISGLIGVATAFLYVKLQNRIRYSRLVLFIFVTIFLFVALSRVLSGYIASPRLIYALFVMLGPITSLLILVFYGLFGRLFDLRQTKRLVGGIDTGQLIATIITFYTVPLLANFINPITNFLIIGEFGLVMAMIIVILIISTQKLSGKSTGVRERNKETGLGHLLRNKYVIFLAIFLLCSMLAMNILDFSFWSISHLQYPDEKQLASFLGVFEGSIMIICLLLQTMVNERLQRLYGPRTALLILPIILVVFAGLTIFYGNLSGLIISDPNFAWFFIFLSLSTLFARSLREATEFPVVKVFFSPLDEKVRFDIQAKLEGFWNEFSRALGFGLILLFGMIPDFDLLHYFYILLAILAVWIAVTFLIYNQYKEKIKEALERGKKTLKEVIIQRIRPQLDRKSPADLALGLRLLSKIDRDGMHQVIDRSGILESGSDHAFEILEEDSYSLAITFMKVQSPISIAKEIGQGGAASEGPQLPEILEMLKLSADPEQRRRAAGLIMELPGDESLTWISHFLNDPDNRVVKMAMFASSYLKRVEFLPVIIENLSRKSLKYAAMDALVNYGEMAFPFLDSLFYNTENQEVRLSIIRTLGNIGGVAAAEALWNKINYPDRIVVSEILMALNHCDFTVHESDKSKIREAIERDAEHIVWNLAAVEELKKEEDPHYDRLILAIYDQIKQYYNHVYMLLSMMIVNKNHIQLVKEFVESGDREKVSYALELLDTQLEKDHEFRHIIISLLDNVPEYEKLRRLKQNFAFSEKKPGEILRYIINRDFNQINRWAKACALDAVGAKGYRDYSLELVANLFNPDTLLSEVAARSIYRVDPEAFRKHVRRLERAQQDRMLQLVQDQAGKESQVLRPYLRFEIVDFMNTQSSLSSFPSFVIANMGELMEEKYYPSGSVVDNEDLDYSAFAIVYKGSLELIDAAGQLVRSYRPGEFMGEDFSYERIRHSVHFRFSEDTVLLLIGKNEFYDLVTSDFEVTMKLLDVIGNGVRGENGEETGIAADEPATAGP